MPCIKGSAAATSVAENEEELRVRAPQLCRRNPTLREAYRNPNFPCFRAREEVRRGRLTSERARAPRARGGGACGQGLPPPNLGIHSHPQAVKVFRHLAGEKTNRGIHNGRVGRTPRAILRWKCLGPDGRNIGTGSVAPTRKRRRVLVGRAKHRKDSPIKVSGQGGGM